MCPNHASMCIPLPGLCYPALLYSTLFWCLNVCLALTWHSTSNLFLKRQQDIPKMVETAVLKAFPFLFLLLWSLLATALTSKHLSLANIISWLSLPTLLWTACLDNTQYKGNSFKEMWRNQSTWFPSLSSAYHAKTLTVALSKTFRVLGSAMPCSNRDCSRVRSGNVSQLPITTKSISLKIRK